MDELEERVRRPGSPRQKAVAVLAAAVGVGLIAFGGHSRMARNQEARDRTVAAVDVATRQALDETSDAIGGVPSPPAGAELVRQQALVLPSGRQDLSWTYRAADLTADQVVQQYRAVLSEGWVGRPDDHALARFERTVNGHRYVIVIGPLKRSTFDVEVRVRAAGG
ncbi:MAG: hypothetical protein JWN67_887 [Actinomycetia bacterium]|nr:hypothetical protein [Actinomycetes bacterium]